MAADITKVIERIHKLLNLAAPSSGSTEAERSSAALEALRLMQDHKLTINFEQEDEGGRVRGGNGGGGTKRDMVWVLTIAPDITWCVHCKGRISKNDHVWCRVERTTHEVQFLHNYAPCWKK